MQLNHLEVGTEGKELGATPEARGADSSAIGQLIQRAGTADIGVGRRLRRRNPGDLEPLGQLARKVLGRVHPEIDLSVQERPLDLADEAGLVVMRGRSDGSRALPLGATRLVSEERPVLS